MQSEYKHRKTGKPLALSVPDITNRMGKIKHKPLHFHNMKRYSDDNGLDVCLRFPVND